MCISPGLVCAFRGSSCRGFHRWCRITDGLLLNCLKVIGQCVQQWTWSCRHDPVGESVLAVVLLPWLEWAFSFWVWRHGNDPPGVVNLAVLPPRNISLEWASSCWAWLCRRGCSCCPGTPGRRSPPQLLSLHLLVQPHCSDFPLFGSIKLVCGNQVSWWSGRVSFVWVVGGGQFGCCHNRFSCIGGHVSCCAANSVIHKAMCV